MNIRSIKLKHLYTFLEVARQGSISKAAEALGVSQPAASRTIGELERELAVALIEREGRGIRLTRFGTVFLGHAGAGLAAMRQGIDSIGQALRNEGPPVRIGALPTVSARIMPRAVQMFLESGARGLLSIVTGDNQTLFQKLREGELDLVIGRLAAPETMTGFSFKHLYSEKVVLVVRPGHPLLQGAQFNFDAITAHPVLIPTQQSIIRPFVDRFLLANGIAELLQRIETVSDSFGRSFLRQSDAVWIISEGVVANDLDDGSLVRLPFDTSETLGAVGLTTRRDSQPTATLSILRDAVLRAAREVDSRRAFQPTAG